MRAWFHISPSIIHFRSCLVSNAILRSFQSNFNLQFMFSLFLYLLIYYYASIHYSNLAILALFQLPKIQNVFIQNSGFSNPTLYLYFESLVFFLCFFSLTSRSPSRFFSISNLVTINDALNLFVLPAK